MRDTLRYFNSFFSLSCFYVVCRCTAWFFLFVFFGRDGWHNKFLVFTLHPSVVIHIEAAFGHQGPAHEKNGTTRTHVQQNIFIWQRGVVRNLANFNRACPIKCDVMRAHPDRCFVCSARVLALSLCWCCYILLCSFFPQRQHGDGARRTGGKPCTWDAKTSGTPEMFPCRLMRVNGGRRRQRR